MENRELEILRIEIQECDVCMALKEKGIIPAVCSEHLQAQFEIEMDREDWRTN